jgi:hypothetical protein
VAKLPLRVGAVVIVRLRVGTRVANVRLRVGATVVIVRLRVGATAVTRLLLAGCVAVTWRLAFFSFCGSACPVVEKAKAAIVPIIANRFIDKIRRAAARFITSFSRYFRRQIQGVSLRAGYEYEKSD